MIKVTGYRLNQPTFKAETAEVKKDAPKDELKDEQKVSEGMSIEKKVGLGAALVALAAVGIYMARGKKASNKGVDELSDLSRKAPDLKGSDKDELVKKGADELIEEISDLTKKGVDDLNKVAGDINKDTKEIAEEFSDLINKSADDLDNDLVNTSKIRTASHENLKKIHRQRLYNRLERLDELNPPQYEETPNIGKPSFKEKLSNIKNSIGETYTSAVKWVKGIGKPQKNKGLSELTQMP